MKNDKIFRAIGDIDSELLENFESNLYKFNTIPQRKESVAKKIGIHSLAVACLFIVLVNVSPTFAYAMSHIPLLDKLAIAVNFSYSLSRAVDEEFVQVVGQSKTQDGITLTIEHLIVDKKELNIFFTIEGENGIGYRVDPELTNLNDTKPGNLITWSSDTGSGIEKSTDLRHISFGFKDVIHSPLSVNMKVFEINNENVSEPVEIEGGIFDLENNHTPTDYLTEMTFILEFDPYFTEQLRVYEVNKTFQLNEQSITIENLEVYPTQMQMSVLVSEDNTKHLNFLTFDLYNQDGDKLEGNKGGLVRSSDLENPQKSIYYLESDFFDNSESITLVVTEAQWLDKSRESVKFDLKNSNVEWIHPGVTFSSELTNQGYLLNFDTQLITYETELGAIGYELGGWDWNTTYYNEKGDEFYATTQMSTVHTIEGTNQEVSRHTIPLANYYEDLVWLTPIYDEVTQENLEILLY